MRTRECLVAGSNLDPGDAVFLPHYRHTTRGKLAISRPIGARLVR